MKREISKMTGEDEKGSVQIVRLATGVKGKTKKLSEGKVHSFSYAC